MFSVETYIETVFKAVLAKFRWQFNFNHFPNKSMIYRCVKKFKSKETELKLIERSEKIITGRQLSVRIPEIVHAVQTSVGLSPRKSIQRRGQKRMVAILNTHLNERKHNCGCYDLKLPGLNCCMLE